MRVEEIRTPQEKERYSRIAAETGTLFNRPEWLDTFGDRAKILGFYDKGGRLVGGFSLYRQKRLLWTIYRDPPLTPGIGPVLSLEAKNYPSILTKQKEALAAMALAIDRLPYSIVSLSLNRSVVDTQPFLWKKFKVTPVYTYLLDLQKSADEIYKGMGSEKRNDIQKALKDGLTTGPVEDYRIVKTLVLKSFARQKKNFDRRHLDDVLFRAARPENSFAFAAYARSRPLAASFCVHDRTTAYYLLGGYDSEGKHHGAGTLALWGAIQQAQGLGLQYFDFEGSMIPAIERYFRGFGGRIVPYYRLNKARWLYEVFLKIPKREFF